MARKWTICAKPFTRSTKGWGANKQKTIDALATQDATTRYYMAIRYKELYAVELQEIMKKEFSGDLGLALRWLAMPADQAEAKMIKEASKGVGAQVNVIWSTLVGRTNEEMTRLKKTYFDMYSKDMGKLLSHELTGDMERLIFNCLQASEEAYDPQFHTAEKAKEDAEIIHSLGQGRWGTNERGLFKIICASPKEHLENISAAYADTYGYTLRKGMEKEFSGMTDSRNVKEAVMHLIGMKLKPYQTMAELIKAACAGFGTDEMLLTACVIRFQPVLAEVQTAHIELYGKTIHDRVRSECRGKFETTLLQILNTAWPEEG